MKNFSLAVVAVAVFGFASAAEAGPANLVDFTLYTIFEDGFAPGQVTIRTSEGVNLIAAAMKFGGAAGGTFTFLPLAPQPNVNPSSSLVLDLLADLIVQANPTPVPGEFVHTGGSSLAFGTLSNFADVDTFGCSPVGFDCVGLFGGGVVDINLGDITQHTGYRIVPEPTTLALLGLGLASLAFLRRAVA